MVVVPPPFLCIPGKKRKQEAKRRKGTASIRKTKLSSNSQKSSDSHWWELSDMATSNCMINVAFIFKIWDIVSLNKRRRVRKKRHLDTGLVTSSVCPRPRDMPLAYLGNMILLLYVFACPYNGGMSSRDTNSFPLHIVPQLNMWLKLLESNCRSIHSFIYSFLETLLSDRHKAPHYGDDGVKLTSAVVELAFQ